MTIPDELKFLLNTSEREQVFNAVKSIQIPFGITDVHKMMEKNGVTLEMTAITDVLLGLSLQGYLIRHALDLGGGKKAIYFDKNHKLWVMDLK